MFNSFIICFFIGMLTGVFMMAISWSILEHNREKMMRNIHKPQVGYYPCNIDHAQFVDDDGNIDFKKICDIMSRPITPIPGIDKNKQ